jgi:hypothetical protein
MDSIRNPPERDKPGHKMAAQRRACDACYKRKVFDNPRSLLPAYLLHVSGTWPDRVSPLRLPATD